MANVGHEHGERYRSWRSVSSSIVTDEFSDFPLEGPRKVQWVDHSFAREGHDLVTWLEKTLAVKRFSETGRSVYRLAAIAEVLRFAGCYDQLNLGGNRHPQAPCYEASDHFGIGGADIEQLRGKVRELWATPWTEARRQ